MRQPLTETQSKSRVGVVVPVLFWIATKGWNLSVAASAAMFTVPKKLSSTWKRVASGKVMSIVNNLKTLASIVVVPDCGAWPVVVVVPSLPSIVTFMFAVNRNHAYLVIEVSVALNAVASPITTVCAV